MQSLLMYILRKLRCIPPLQERTHAHIFSSSKRKDTQDHSVISLSPFSSDLSLNGSSVCSRYKCSPNGLKTRKTKQRRHLVPKISAQWNTSEKLCCAMWEPALSTVIIRTSDVVMACGGMVLLLSSWVSDSLWRCFGISWCNNTHLRLVMLVCLILAVVCEL